MSLPLYSGARLDLQNNKGGISRTTPPKLAFQYQSLPPILHKSPQRSLSSYSKGSRGLSVFLRVLGIFTEISNSLSIWLRHRGSRYAIRAGRNLPDKEFRYLRTVIVTAAVYRGFNSPLRSKELTDPLNLPAPGRRQAVYIFLSKLAQPCVFDKQSLPPFHCDHHASDGTPYSEVTVSSCRVP